MLGALAALWLLGCGKPADVSGTTGGETKKGSNEGTTGSPGAPTAEITLRLSAKKGDKMTMDTEMDAVADISGLKVPDNLPPEQKKVLEGPQTMKIRGTDEREVIAVDGDKITWRVKNVKFEAEGTGPLQQAAAGMAATEKGKTEDRTFTTRNERVKASEDKGETPLSVVYPEKAIKPGEIWSSETTFNGEKVKADYSYEKEETVDGKDCVIIKLTFSGSEHVTTPEPLRLWIDRSNGWPVKGEGTVHMENPEQGLKTDLTFKMKVH
jgi:hypothetical protein